MHHFDDEKNQEKGISTWHYLIRERLQCGYVYELFSDLLRLKITCHNRESGPVTAY
jgi:hypothetical protein